MITRVCNLYVTNLKQAKVVYLMLGVGDMIKILTLGDFDIIIDDKSVIEEMTSQKRLIRLLKYFLVNNERKLLPENIIEDLWGVMIIKTL